MKALTMYYPWCYLWLMDIKIYETRSRSVRCNLPTQLIVHCAKRKPDTAAQSLADKYLGADFKPDYGHVIGICTLTDTVEMTPELIQAQSSQELELGIWESGRVAWQATDKSLFKVPIAATGKQAAPWTVNKDLVKQIKHTNSNELLQQF